MKKSLTILISIFWIILLIPKLTFGQEKKSYLTPKEYHTLDSLLIKKKVEFSFKNKKVAFISGHSVTHIQNKKVFFKQYITNYFKKNIKPTITYRVLNKQEKKKSGGYDVIVMQTPKILTKKQHYTNIKNLAHKTINL